MKPVIIYCYDAYCGWCYGFSTVISRIWSSYKSEIDFEVLSGGMILPEKPVHISATAAYIQRAYTNVETRTGIKFGEDYLWHIRNPELSDWYPDSRKPAIALCIFKEYYPLLQVSFAADLQYALHSEGRDLCDDEAYRHLIEKYGIPVEEFYRKLHEDDYRQKAFDEFALMKQLKMTGYPAVYMQVAESKFYLLSNGYTDYAKLEQNILSVLSDHTGSGLQG